MSNINKPAIAATILFALLFLSVFCVCYSDADGYSEIGEKFDYENLCYKVTKDKTESEPGEVEVWGPGDGVAQEGDINIPKTVENTSGTKYTVTSISSQAFYLCDGFDGSLTIPDSVTFIGQSAFHGCSGLTGSLIIPDSVTFIDCFAFKGCSGLTGSLIIPDSITTIEEEAFYDCSGFTGSLIIPNSVTSIKKTAFYGCSGFTGPLTISDSVTSVGDNAFINCSGFNALAIGEDVKDIHESAFYGWSFVDSDGQSISVGPGMVFEKDSDGNMVDQGNVWMVTCSDDDGSLMDYYFFARGDKIDKEDLPSPSRAGFIFKGWAKDGEPVTVPHYVNDNEVLMAVWEKEKSIKMSFVDDGGSELLDPMFFSIGDKFKMPAPIKEGYVFDKWIDKNGGEWKFKAEYEVEGDMVFTAVWEEVIEQSILSFVDSDGTVLFKPVSINNGETYTLPAAIKEGYRFEGWSDSDGKVWKYMGEYEVGGDMTFTAQWTEIPQPVQTGGGISPAVAAAIGAACILAGIIGTFFVMRYKK